MNSKPATFLKYLTGGIILFFLPILIYWTFHTTGIGKSWQDTPFSNTLFWVTTGLFVLVEFVAATCYCIPHIRAWVNNPKNRKSLTGLFLIGIALPFLSLQTLLTIVLYGCILLSTIFLWKGIQKMHKENTKS